ncbi:MAG TPA: hypothetical protein VGA40_00885, partial [Candidatus Acidoferrales bacterium]
MMPVKTGTVVGYRMVLNHICCAVVRRGVFVAVCALGVAAQLPQEPPRTLDELAERHLRAMGRDAARAAVKSRTGAGGFQFTLRNAQGQQQPPPGKVAFAAEGSNVAMVLTFGHPDYDHESFSFDGKEVRISTIQPGGSRSPLGEILFGYDFLVREGILGSVLRPGWLFTQPEQRKASLEFLGRRQAGLRSFYAVKYTPPVESDLEVILYFDTETYRHAQSRYEVKRGEQTFMVEEVFEAFREFDGVTLPTRWLLRFTA